MRAEAEDAKRGGESAVGLDAQEHKEDIVSTCCDCLHAMQDPHVPRAEKRTITKIETPVHCTLRVGAFNMCTRNRSTVWFFAYAEYSFK